MKRFLLPLIGAFLFLTVPVKADDLQEQPGKFYLDTSTGNVSQRLDNLERGQKVLESGQKVTNDRLDAIERKLDAVLSGGKVAAAPAKPIVNPLSSATMTPQAQPVRYKTVQICENGRCRFVQIVDNSPRPEEYVTNGTCQCQPHIAGTPWNYGDNCRMSNCPANGGAGGCPCSSASTYRPPAYPQTGGGFAGSRVFTSPGGGHTHTCPYDGTTWDHSMNASHNCPTCGMEVTTQSGSVGMTGGFATRATTRTTGPVRGFFGRIFGRARGSCGQ